MTSRNRDINKEEDDEEVEVEERDEEEEDEEPEERPKAKAQAPASRSKKPVEEDDEEEKPQQTKKPTQATQTKRRPADDDDYDEDDKRGSSTRDREAKKNQSHHDDDEDYGGSGGDAEIPNEFGHFLRELRKTLREKHTYELQSLYEHDFYELTDRLYKNVRLPSVKQVTPYIGEDKHCQVLYKELYFRHVYQKLGPTVDDRFDSFENYIDLLDILLGLKLEKPEIDLPVQWLWDILDEFIYQFRSFHEFRTDFRRQNLDEKDLDLIKQHQHLWSAQTVIEYLHELAKKGGIDLSKSWFRKGTGDEKILQKTDGISDLFVTLSQFSLIGLSRVYCLLGDYTSSIKVLDSIDLSNKQSPFHSTLAAKVTLHYYLGFAYLMLRRYADAVKTFSYFLVFVNRNKHTFPRPVGPDVVDQMVAKMYGLLSIANSLSPQTLDESLHTQLKDRFKSGTPESLFESACPAFISPAPPDYSQQQQQQQQVDDNDNSRLSPAGRLQKRIFLNEIKQRSNLPQTYGYLKMCTNVHISKLGTFLDFESDKEKEKEIEKEKQRDREERKARERAADGKFDEKEREREKEREKEKDREREKEKKEEKERREKEKSNPVLRAKRDEETATILLKLKHKTRNLRWQSSGSASSGRWVSSSEVDFYLDKDVVHIGDHTASRRYGDFFIRHILKYQGMIDELRQSK